MRKTFWAVVALLGFAAWADFNTALDCNGLTFATGGDANWFEQTDNAKVGGSALRSGAITDNQETWLETTVTNAGTISFWWKVSSESVSYDWLEVSVGGVQKSLIGGTDGDWEQVSVIVSAGQIVRWTYRKDVSASVGEDCGWLDGIAFTPAPESMTVTFVTNGGGEIAPTNVTPGVTYGDLPVPEKEGDEEFVGWFLDEEFTQKANKDDPILFHDHTLYAKWLAPLSLLNTKDMTFGQTDETWSAVRDEEAVGGFSIANAENSSAGEFFAQVTNSYGTLRFFYKLESNASVLISAWNQQYDFYGPTEWTEMQVEIAVEENGHWEWDEDADDDIWVLEPPAATQEVRFESLARKKLPRGAIAFRDFEWTPAPETLKVVFDPNGGTCDETEREYVPGETYDHGGEAQLPVPVRPGFAFLGWFVGSTDGTKALDFESVPFRDTVALVAKWGQDVSALDAEVMTAFVSGTNAVWHAVQYGEQKFAEVELPGKLGASKWDPEYESPISVSSDLRTTTVAPGYLDFTLSLKASVPQKWGGGGWRRKWNGYMEMTVYLDDKKVVSHEVDGHATREAPVSIYLPAGEHVLKWEVAGHPACIETSYGDYDETDDGTSYLFGAGPIARIGDFRFEADADQPDLQTWSGKTRKYKSWRKGDLARFAAEYKSRFAVDANDYEARILYAVTRLGALAEDDTFKGYAESFGFTVDWARLSVTPPEPSFGANNAAVNAMADETLALVGPVVADVQDALDGIPADWTGAVTLSSDEWPLDEPVAIDIADVLFARAGLDAALAGLNYLAAYDLTTDWEKVGEMADLKTVIPVLDKLPGIDDDEGWSAARHFRTKVAVEGVEGSGEMSGVVAIHGNKVAFLVTSPIDITESNPVEDLAFEIGSGDIRIGFGWERQWQEDEETGEWSREDGLYGTRDITLRVWKDGVPEASEGRQDVSSASVSIEGGKLLLCADLSEVFADQDADGTPLGEREWTVGSGWAWSSRQFVRWSAQKDGARKVQKLLDDQTAFFSRVRDAGKLATACGMFKAALERALVADGRATSRPDGGAMHFFEYDPEDVQMIAFARTNTRRALASLGAPIEVDMAQFAADYDAASSNRTKIAGCNYTLLPNEGMTRIYLGALFEGRIARDMKPQTSVDAYGELVVDFDSLSDPTFGGLLPDMTAKALEDFVDDAVCGSSQTWPDATLVIPPGTETIPDYAFAGYSFLREVWVPSSVQTIGGCAFANCVALEHASLPETLRAQVAENNVFQGDDGVEVVYYSLGNVTATFDANGGESKEFERMLPAGTPLGELPEDPVRTGYAFGGWFAADGSRANPKALVLSNETVVAQWTANRYTVRFDANGGEGEMADQAFTYGVVAPLAASAFHLPDARFLGWAEEPDGDVLYADGESVSNLTSAADGAVTLYAQWTLQAVAFEDADITVDEGSNATVRVLGGNADRASSVKVYLTYNTATAADLNLGKVKYPVTLKWAKGDLDPKTVTIPIKKDTLLEGKEAFTLQLAAASGVEMGEQTVCTVRITDAQWTEPSAGAEPAQALESALPAGATAISNSTGAVVGYFTKKDKKGNVTAKAMPGYVFTGWYDAKGKLVSSKAALADKTRKSKKATPKFEVAHYLRGLADPANGGKVTGSGLYAEGKKVTLKATPNKNWTFEGWRLASDELRVTSDEIVSKAKSLKVSVTNELTYLAMFKPYPKVTVAVDNAKGGAVKGAGSYLAGKTVTLSATPKKGYAFCGWFDADGNRVSLNTSYKYTVTADGLTLQASFKKERALAKPVLTWDATNLTVGVSYSAKLSVVGESLTSITKVTGLPKGLTYKSGKVSGVPTVAKAVTAKVTVALKSNAKKTWTYSVKLNVSALPAWAVGTFKGKGTFGGKDANVTLTVGKTGKISGKFVAAGKQYSFSAASFKTCDEDGVLRAQATMKYGKKPVTIDVAVAAAQNDAGETGGVAEVGAADTPFGNASAQLGK